VTPAVEAAIRRAAAEQGVDPAFALAVADRESRGDPGARSSKTIAGAFQMRGDLRRQYGGAKADSLDPADQANAWMPFIKDVKGEMARTLGRMPTDAEGYLGHHYGAIRAARTLKMDPETPVDQVFTPYERSQNPHFDKAGTIGALNSSITADIGKRQAKFGAGQAAPMDYSSLSEPTEAPAPPPAAPKPSQWADATPADTTGTMPAALAGPAPASVQTASAKPALDFSSLDAQPVPT
jgi:hypothetical protein